jgi:predicted GIY-YIG superfamily endonuclease
VGQTQDLSERLRRHNNPTEGTYTARRGPWELAYFEEHPNRALAVRRERFLKSVAGSREKKRLAACGAGRHPDGVD